ncbi:DUF6292 family protein [Streptomyces sp. S.PB5]|uniref:DUF6292 family protein n=1 Tax=Streptomyces sp. S.PB5 TaxID=3020844 RepID=UPI0025AF2CA1|nr:DUF6292 family protein [Streptomyces sp. S.PB5]MDN3026003.1 DUF6292 family protein [Streptomyces sp. S.PB5]
MRETTRKLRWKVLKDRLETEVGHYTVAVAERLLADGLPVISVYAYAAYDEHEINDADVEGSIHFSREFQSGLNGPAESFLHWVGTSGWCYRTIQDTASADSPGESARWLSAGLLPSPDRVAAFVSAIRVDPETAGSDERPFYRAACDQMYELTAGLSPYAPGPWHSPLAHVNYEYRFIEAQGSAYRDRVMKELVSGDDRVLFLPIRNSELHALRLLLDYTEAVAPVTGPYDLARSLAQDLSRRTPGDHRSVHEHCQARSSVALQEGHYDRHA